MSCLMFTYHSNNCVDFIVNTLHFNYGAYIFISTIVQLNHNNYTNVNPSSNGPIAPPTLHSTVPYSTIVHETSITGQYSLVQQYYSWYLINRLSKLDLIITCMLISLFYEQAQCSLFLIISTCSTPFSNLDG